jgi:uncharacterized damage-inducible protein DinB
MSDAARIADQLRRAFDGDAWHGDSLFEILEGVTAERAAARPVAGAHTIWELALHIAAWDDAALRRMGGAVVELSDAESFPPVTDTSEAAWRAALAAVRRGHERLVAARLLQRFRTLGFLRWSRARRERTIPFITCSMGWCSMSFIMRGRLLC